MFLYSVVLSNHNFLGSEVFAGRDNPAVVVRKERKKKTETPKRF